MTFSYGQAACDVSLVARYPRSPRRLISSATAGGVIASQLASPVRIFASTSRE